MSLWQFSAAVAGWNRVHGAADDAAKPAAPTDQEFDAMLDAHAARAANSNRVMNGH